MLQNNEQLQQIELALKNIKVPEVNECELFYILLGTS